MNIEDISSMTAEAVNLLQSFIRIPSFSHEEKDLADFLQNHIEAEGMQCGRKGNNVWCLSPMFNLKKPTILLNAHLDTAKPTKGWRKDPFTPRVENGKVYGTGSNDAGASLATLLQVFLHLCRTTQPYNLIYLASCEEEQANGTGVESVLPEFPPIHLAIVGKPTEMQPAIAEKGSMVLDVTAKGRLGTASQGDGVNAIYKALEDIAWFREYQFPKVSPLLGNVQMHVTQIEAGTQYNQVPDQCRFVVHVCSNGCYTNQELLTEIQQHVTSQVEARSLRYNASFIPEEHPIVQRALLLGRKPFASPTLSDQAVLPFTSIKIGPGRASRARMTDEYVMVKEMEEAIEIYLKLLDGLICK